MRIGDLTRRAGVTARTVRYYESLGLMPPGEREGGGQHRYGAEAVARLLKIEQLKALGLSLEEVGQVIDLYFTDPSGRRAKHQVLAMLRRHLEDVDRRIGVMADARADLIAHIDRFEAWLALAPPTEGKEDHD
jgi:DNA-binding transcriptional MerR regulator